MSPESGVNTARNFIQVAQINDLMLTWWTRESCPIARLHRATNPFAVARLSNLLLLAFDHPQDVAPGQTPSRDNVKLTSSSAGG